MTTIEEFLVERVNEDERRASAEKHFRIGDPYFEDRRSIVEFSDFERTYTPDAIRRRSAAAWLIMGEHRLTEDGRTCVTCVDREAVMGDQEEHQFWPCRSIRALAEIYIEHPDFNPDWRVTP